MLVTRHQLNNKLSSSSSSDVNNNQGATAFNSSTSQYDDSNTVYFNRASIDSRRGSSAGNTLDWMLSIHRNKKSAKRFFKRVLENKHVQNPRVINVDKSPTFPGTLSELQNENSFPEKTKLRPIKYLNNAVENDHKSTKFKSRYRQWYQTFETAQCALDGMEIMRAVQKGQLKRCPKGDVCAQNKLINKVFGLAA